MNVLLTVSKLRKPLIVVALLLSIAIVLVEQVKLAPGTVTALIPSFPIANQEADSGALSDLLTPEQQAELDELRAKKEEEAGKRLTQDVEGFGVPMLQFVDGIMIFSLALITAGLFVPPAVQAKAQGILTLIFAIVVIIFGIVKLFVILAKLITMVLLFLSFPFGTLAYLIIYGSFDRATAQAFLGILFMLKIVLGILIVLANQRFLENLGLVLIFLTTLIANIIVSILLGIVPGILASITDAIAAIVVIIIAIIWALILGIVSLLSIIAAFKPV